MKPNRQLASALRSLGLRRLVDSPRVRRWLDIPIRTQPSDYIQQHGIAPLSDEQRQDAEPRSTEPLVSVVVPAYNVEQYISTTLQTVLNQSYKNLEVLVVNDGSTDSTRQVIDELATQDSRLRVFHVTNAGPGAARNLAVDNAAGEFLTFVDADDELPPDSIRVRMESLLESGSDFVVGSFERFSLHRVWKPQWTEGPHGRRVRGVSASDMPDILWDVTLWNKIYRRRSWDHYVGRIPEGVLYEDQKPTARLFIEGASFDVVPEITYRWRFRDNLSSITQNKSSSEDLDHRLAAVEVVRELLEVKGESPLRSFWYSKLLGEDLFYYAREVPNADEGFYEKLSAAAREYLGHADEGSLLSVAFDRRVLALALARASREDFIRVLVYFQENGWTWGTQLTDSDAVLGWVPVLDEIQVGFQDWERQIVPAAQVAKAKILRFASLEDGSVKLAGYLHVVGLPVGPSRTVQARLLPLDGSSDDESAFPLVVAAIASPEAVVSSGEKYIDNYDSGFEILLSRDMLSELSSRQVSGSVSGWRLSLSLSDWNSYWDDVEISLDRSGRAAALGAGRLNDQNQRYHLSWEAKNLRVSVDRPRFVAEQCHARGNEIQLIVRDHHYPDGVTDEPGLMEMRVVGSPLVFSRCALTPNGQGRWSASLIMPSLAPVMTKNSVNYPLEIVDTAGEAPQVHAVATGAEFESVFAKAPFAVGSTTGGWLRIQRFAQYCEVRSVRLADSGESIVLEGICRFDLNQVRNTTPTFMLWKKDRTLRSSSLAYRESDGTFEVRFSLVDTDIDLSKRYVDHGDYVFGVLMPTGKSLPASVGAVCGNGLAEKLPLELRENSARVVLKRKYDTGGLFVSVSAPFLQNERGPRAQKLLSSTWFGSQKSGLERAVFFESFDGQSVADSPKALDRWLRNNDIDVVRYWSVQNYSVPVPQGAISLLKYSSAWYEALTRSQYLVNSNNFPSFFRKSTGQTYIQTWHGTPLKRVGNDIPSGHLSASYRRTMQREAGEYWDYLIAQTPWAGNILTGAFAFDGEVLSEGYPRNDALLATNAEVRRAEVRAFLGLASDQKAVLYAPTWRDNIRGSNGNFLQPNYLDAAQLHKRYGRNVVVLVRAHGNTLKSPLQVAGPNVINVSKYPDINDLYLAADVLVTDYSSVMFDFVNTGKPMVFLVPDIAEYRDLLRGFYFDFEREAPGPLVEDTTQAIHYIDGLSDRPLDPSSAYSNFKERFACFDDGLATDRVARQVFRDRE